MYIKKDEMKVEIRENMRGGGGNVAVQSLIDKAKLPKKCRMFGVMTIEKGCGIGAHDHVNETEFYYCLSGEGVVLDEGKELPFMAGDCTSCGEGKSHAIRNEKDEPLVVLACIVLE